MAWRSIFWVSLPPGLLFVIGSFMVAESPRWLFRRGKKDAARAALLRSRTPGQADVELKEMEASRWPPKRRRLPPADKARESLLRRKYVIPFVLACIILACNQATGINSIIGYNANILLQSGLSDVQAHWGYVIFTIVNFLVTLAASCWWTARAASFCSARAPPASSSRSSAAACCSVDTEKPRVDARDAVQAMVDAGPETHAALQRRNWPPAS